MDSRNRKIINWDFLKVGHLGHFFQYSDQFIGHGVCGQKVLKYQVIHYTGIVCPIKIKLRNLGFDNHQQISIVQNCLSYLNHGLLKLLKTSKKLLNY